MADAAGFAPGGLIPPGLLPHQFNRSTPLGPYPGLWRASLTQLKDKPIMFEIHHTENASKLHKGWFLTGSDSTPNRRRCSIGAAVQLGLVMRHVKPGHLYIPGDRGALSFETGIAEGLLDQEAADFIAKQPGCFNPAPQTAISHVPAAPKRGTLASYSGTPIGDFMTALQTWRLSPGIDEQTKVAQALEVLLGQRA